MPTCTFTIYCNVDVLKSQNALHCQHHVPINLTINLIKYLHQWQILTSTFMLLKANTCIVLLERVQKTSCPWYIIKALIITKTISPTGSKSQLDCLSLCISFQVLFSNDLGSSLAMSWQPFSANEQNNKGRVSINCNLLLVRHVMCTLSPPGGHCTLTRCLT